jgi:hypothetical protein
MGIGRGLGTGRGERGCGSLLFGDSRFEEELPCKLKLVLLFGEL